MAASKQRKPSSKLPLYESAEILIVDRTGTLLSELSKSLKKTSTKRIHDLRVASRRLRESLSLFRQILNGSNYRKPLRKTKKLTRMLGDARNLDVLYKILTGIIEHQPETPEAHAARHYRRHIASQKKAARAQLKKNLQQYESLSLEKSISQLIRHLKTHPSDLLTRDILESALSDRIQRVFDLKEEALNRSSVKAQHQLRIAIKKLRYRLEILSFVLGAAGQKIVRKLTSFQDMLGEIHDHVVLVEGMRQWMCQKNLGNDDPDLAAQYDALFADLTERNNTLHAKFVRQFSPVQMEEFKNALFSDLAL